MGTERKPALSEQQQNEALSFRVKALALLQQAEAIDGLKPFMILHEHDSGSSGYVAWHHREPTEDEASLVLEAQFEPDRGESLAIEQSVTLEELTGVSLTSRICDALDTLSSLSNL